MPDERSADFSFVHAFGWSGSRRRVDPFPPRPGPARAPPFEHAPTTVHRCAVTWLEDKFAVEVVGARFAVKWRRGLCCVISPRRRWLSELREKRPARR